MKTPRPYQKQALEALKNHKGATALIEMATGLGKTALIAMFCRWWIDSGMGETILFVMHMTDPLYQARKEFREAMHGLNLPMGMIIGTDKEHIDAPIVFSTFQSLDGILEEIPSDDFGLVIVDEAHHGHAASYRRIIQHFRPKLLCGMTATVDRMDGLDIRQLFGTPLYRYTLDHALAEGKYLAGVDYKVVVDNVNNEMLAILRRRLTHGDGMITLGSIDAGVFLHADLDQIATIIQEELAGEDLKTIIFCSSIEQIEAMERRFPDGKAYHTGVKPAVLEERLEAFRSGALRKILVRDKFNEAMDIPDAQLVVFLRSTDSRTIWFQQLGRGLRKAEGKDRVRILDFAANCRRIMNIQGLAQRVSENRLELGTNEESGLAVSYSHKMIRIVELIELLKMRYYLTWEEASEAARALRITLGSAEYKLLHYRDPRLPPSPAKFYSEEWSIRGGWKGFLGIHQNTRLSKKRKDRKECVTYEEARELVRQYRIQSIEEYLRWHRSIDERLPARPWNLYKVEWIQNGDWSGFLGKKSVAKLIPSNTKKG